MQGTKQKDTETLAFETHCGELGDAPCFRLLSGEKLQRIHEASLEVLEDVGVRFTTEAARKLLADAGCTVADEDIVKIPRRVVEDAINSAPERVVIYDREGEEALTLEGRNTHFGLGITGIHFRDLESGERRGPRIEDVALACRVADALPNLDFIATPLVLEATREMPRKVVKQIEFEAMLSNTTKPLMLLVDYVPILRDVLEMTAAVAGGTDALRERPFVLPYFNSVSPLTYNTDTLDNLLLLAEWGIPVICSPAPMAGATGPVTLAGTVTTSNAEALAGLVVSQLKRPGAPFIVGSEAAILDMRTANIAFGAPEQNTLVMAAVEMAHYYGLPVAGLGCASDSMGVDQQAALEQMLGAYSSILAGVHLVPFIGFLEAGLTFSLEAAVMGDEIVGMVKRIMRGMPVDDESLAPDTIRAVGPGGNFLETEHTFRHYKREQWQPTLLCRTTFDSWVQGGSKLMGERVKEKLEDIIQSHRVKPLPEEVKAQMSAIIERRLHSLS
ncbi:MAG: trimethylamine methyltransferase family protein [Dehalococcoidia bacterium]